MANISSFDLNLLRVLHAMLEDPSTVRAADRLGLSQPAVSAAIARLRDQLGDVLFFRRGQGLAPTEYALSLRAPLAQIMAQTEALIAPRAAFDPATSSARFKISGSDFFAELLMPKLAERLQVVAPNMMVHLVDLVPEDHIDTLEQFNVDLALIPAFDLPDWVEHQLAFRSSFVAVARADHPRLTHAGLRTRDVIPLDLFCDLGHVVFSPEGHDRAMGDAALEALGRSRNVVMTMPSFTGVYRAVAGSDLIALLPQALAHHIADQAGLELYHAPMDLPIVELHMVWHRRQSGDPAHAWLCQEIARLLVPLDEAGAQLH